MKNEKKPIHTELTNLQVTISYIPKLINAQWVFAICRKRVNMLHINMLKKIHYYLYSCQNIGFITTDI